MALIVETGAGLSNSESYISVAAADTRHSNLGNTTWADAAMTTAKKEEALRRATQYMLQAFRSRWIGQRRLTTQALDWPRVGVVVDEYTYVPIDSVPADIANACADLALTAAAGDLAPNLERGVKRTKIGPIEKEYDDYSPQGTRYVALKRALAPYLMGSGANARLVRA